MVLRRVEFKGLNDMLVKMAGLVEAAIDQSVTALVERDSMLADRVIQGDREVNDLDIMIDEECVKLLALKQPMATDLRFITTAMKITSDLERIGDNAVNIAERAVELNDEPILKPYVDIPHMGRISRRMVRDAIDAFIQHDRKLALEVIMSDDEVDDLNEAIFEELAAIMTRDPATVWRATKITYVSKYLERIGDHATNIAEMVIYLVGGKIVRHHRGIEDDDMS